MSTIANVFERRKLIERAVSMRARFWHLTRLAGVVLLALMLNAWGVSRAGYGNTYYAAAVRSMTMSWKNFFFHER